MRELLPLIVAVNPVPWARAQMAFTLATHIILVPLGLAVRARPEEPARARARRQRFERCGADPLGLS